MSFSILSVCTGNICRSPVAELLLAERLAKFADVRVESAGTGALVGHDVPQPAQRLARTVGVDASAHRARQIDVAMIREADLIVGMSRDHRRFIVESLPGAMRRSFTLRELARIADVVEPELSTIIPSSGASTVEDGMRTAVARAAALRGTVPPPPSPEAFDIVDPYRRNDDVFAQSFDELAPAAARVAAFLTTAATLANPR